ncbi:hypothetical protein DDZ13_13735 [Coraliomargarita sinensis]|uniref:Helicase SNF2 n=1 Tax=Coraliomargarita sinensis TaxID=2174842 RepID=A0A317ZD09_9BACT|nr:DEAD/DEAH box helicase [Coraliomargarita sinensis]PXA03124.1 hypothetical protein DDZ13_13735 [Coraliomargarita sinensis]
MRSDEAKLGRLADFAQLDLGELYYLGDRRIVERGLRYFRDYAVDSLFWDGRAKRITALVSGSGYAPYEVLLWVRDGHVEHECECPAWDSYGACKHGVAALAAVFAVLNGFQVGSQQIPEDYLQELRSGLGLSSGEALPEPESKSGGKGDTTSFTVIDLSSYGGMRLRVRGAIPYDLLKSAGLHLPHSYGGGQSRELFMGALSRTLKPFLHKAKKAGIPVRWRSGEGEVELTMATRNCRARKDYALRGDKVVRHYVFETIKGDALDVVELIGEFDFALDADGRVYRIQQAKGDSLGPHDGALVHSSSVDSFNRYEVLHGRTEAALQEDFRFQGESMQPLFFTGDACQLQVDCSLWRNAAGEAEYWEFRCGLEVDGVRVDLDGMFLNMLDVTLHAYSGNMLSAKRRVTALMDLIRRFLADYKPGEEFEPSVYARDFSELYGANYRHAVLAILRRHAAMITEMEGDAYALAADAKAGRFLCYEVPVRHLAMLVHGMAEPGSRRDLYDLAEGRITVRRGSSGSSALKRLIGVAQHLGVRVRVDELPVRSEPLSISVDAKASGNDIDWFALHPSIACGERTIEPEEWRDLIRGELLLRGEDGALIMPEAGEGEAAGLEALASMLRVDRMTGQLEAGEPAQVSRLQMLDWIALRRHGVKVELPQEAEEVFQSLLHLRQLPEYEPPEGCAAELRGYQKAGCAWIDFLFRHRFGACLADDMGLGKTVQTISFLVASFERGLSQKHGAPVLIVLPPSLVFNWLDEWQRFAPGVKVRDCLKKSDWDHALAEAEVVLTTYDRVRLDIRELEKKRFQIVVFDEAHNLKNISAARTRAAARLNRRFTLCLTGTPVENNASEFYSVLSAAVPGIFGTHKDFKEVFRKRPDQILGRARPFILRRTKKAILKELPKKEEQVLHLQMTPIQKEIYTRTVAEVREEIAEAFADKPEQQAGIVALAAILRLRQVCVSPALLGKEMPDVAPKFAYMADKLEELHSEGHAALVFSQFIGGLDGLEAEAAARGLDYLRMDGRTPVAKRKGIVAEFQSAGGPPFFLISLKTGGVGLNLTRANYVFHLDPWWNPAVENQATDRAHRIGQRQAVFVQRLIMEHSIESRMMELKNRKADLFRQLVEVPGAKSARSGLSREDFEYLLEG